MLNKCTHTPEELGPEPELDLTHVSRFAAIFSFQFTARWSTSGILLVWSRY